MIPEDHNSKAKVHPGRNILDKGGRRNNKEEVRGDNGGETDSGDQIGGNPHRNQGDTPVPKGTEEDLHKKGAILSMVLVQVKVFEPLRTDVRHGDQEREAKKQKKTPEQKG